MRDKSLWFFLFLSLFLIVFPRFDSPAGRALLLASVFFTFLGVDLYRGRRLRRIISLLRRLGVGDFKARIFVASRDEIGELSKEVNEIARHLEHISSELSLREGEIEGLFRVVKDPLLFLDEIGRVKMANISFAKLIGEREGRNLKGRWYWEVVKERSLFKLAELARDGVGIDGMELVLGDEIYLATVIPLKNGSLIYMKDITERARLRSMESDLISSMAHELKTPLTAIKGAVETVEETGDMDRRFLSIIKRHTERLIKIVSDMLTLQLIKKGADLSFEMVNLRELVEDVSVLFEKEMERKGLGLEIDIPEDAPTLKGDRFMLERALINLLDNAVKYNVEKGRIRVTVRWNESRLKLIVEDTGMGIPREHIPRIFDRFYVVDKSRSRKLGGTGLGLSIVKEAVLLHRGEIEVESSPGEGARFTLIFPL